MSNSEKSAILADILGSFSERDPLLLRFRSAFEARRQLPWLGEGADAGLEEGLRSALSRALSRHSPAFGLPVADGDELSDAASAAAFHKALRGAAGTLPELVVDRYFTLLYRHGVRPDDTAALHEAVKGALEKYVRTKDSGLTADPW
jgi:hypothetical protein